jgi:hypothetical protein
MSNWIADFFTQNPDKAALPVRKQDRFSIHFQRPDGSFEAHFTGSPCHFQDTDGLWKPLDTKLRPVPAGFYSAPGLDYVLHPDGRVKIGSFQHQVALPGKPIGLVDGDRIIRDFPGGQHVMFAMENGYREEIVLTKPFPCKAFVPKQTGSLAARFIQQPMLAVDAKDQVFFFEGDTKSFDAWLEKAVYPVTIDPDFTESTNDGQVRGSDADYAIAHSTSFDRDVASTSFYVGQNFTGSLYRVIRGFLKFDTSAIGAGPTVTQVNLNLVSVTDASTTDFDAQIVKQDWSAQDPIATANREAAFDNCLAGTADASIWRNTSGMSINTQYSSGNLDTAWVNKIGNTYYSMRSSRDLNADVPTGTEYVLIATQENATVGYRPTLTVTYSTSSFIPQIIII